MKLAKFIFLYLSIISIFSNICIASASEEKQCDIVFVVDCSGSMHAQGITPDEIADAISYFCIGLTSYTRIGVILFADSIILNTSMLEIAEIATIEDQIKNAKTSFSGTDLGAALVKGEQLLDRKNDPNVLSYLIVISDGIIELSTENKRTTEDSLTEIANFFSTAIYETIFLLYQADNTSENRTKYFQENQLIYIQTFDELKNALDDYRIKIINSEYEAYISDDSNGDSKINIYRILASAWSILFFICLSMLYIIIKIRKSKENKIVLQSILKRRNTMYKYDIALSYASENSAYVDEVAHALIDKGIKVFYDRIEEANLWGKDLYTYLDDIYQNQSLYCIMFISRYYKEKMWTRHEMQSAYARAIKSKKVYVLPAKFDDTELPGLRLTTAYINLKNRSASNFAKLIIEKLQ